MLNNDSTTSFISFITGPEMAECGMAGDDDLESDGEVDDDDDVIDVCKVRAMLGDMVSVMYCTPYLK